MHFKSQYFHLFNSLSLSGENLLLTCSAKRANIKEQEKGDVFLPNILRMDKSISGRISLESEKRREETETKSKNLSFCPEWFIPQGRNLSDMFVCKCQKQSVRTKRESGFYVYSTDYFIRYIFVL